MLVRPCLVSCVGMRMNSNARISWHCMDGYSYGFFSFFLSTISVLVELSWRRNVFFHFFSCTLLLLFDHYYGVTALILGCDGNFGTAV